ncbi:MAG: PRC-barrel domain-containing protein, partial [Elainellaceae cyanobacterium]
MTDPADILQYRDLAGRLVLDSQTMAELGWVDTLWMYPQRNRVLGVVCRPGRFGAKRLVFKLTQLDTVGENSLLMRGDPEPTVAAKVQQLESLIGQEVWSDRGERVGKLIDCLFNPENGVILRYLMTPGPWAAVTDGTYLLSPKKIISFSAKRT